YILPLSLHHLSPPSFPTRRSSDLDFLVIPNSSPNISKPDPKGAELIDTRAYLANHYCSTLNPTLGACFYSASRGPLPYALGHPRSEEHTSELQSRFDLVCRLLLEK